LINSIEWSKKYSLEILHEDKVSSKMQNTYHSSVDISVLKNLDIMIDLVDLETPPPRPPMVNLGAPKQMERQRRKLIKKRLQLRKSSQSKKISMKIQSHHRTREQKKEN
jgi:hypothetical protein